ncbi:hypothetical protein D3C72_2190000 [compost metagenome]
MLIFEIIADADAGTLEHNALGGPRRKPVPDLDAASISDVRGNCADERAEAFGGNEAAKCDAHWWIALLQLGMPKSLTIRNDREH